VAVVERGDQPDVARQQHAVAEDVARHVAHAGHGEVGGLDVEAQLAEVALDALPRAARGDAHALVVVAGAAAGGEGVAEPVAVLGADGVGVVGEGRRALVGGDHQVGVVAVAPSNLGWCHRLARDQVVGQVEQASQVVLVAGNAFLHEGLAVTGRRRLLQHEAALGAHRHDDGVLDHLRLHQRQHLGAEVVGAVGPAQPAARHLAAAQVDALEARRVDEDLDHGPRRGQSRHARRVELERQERAQRAGRARMPAAGAPEVGTQRALDERLQLAQHAVLGQVLHLLQCPFETAGLRRGGLVVVLGRVQPQLEQLDQHARDGGVAPESGFDGGLRQRKADLLEVLGIGAQHHHLARLQAGAQHQAVEIVVLDFAAQHQQEGVLEAARHLVGLGRVGDLRLQHEVVQRHAGALGQGEMVVVLADHAGAQALEHGQAVRQRHCAAQPVDAKAQRVGRRTQRPHQGHRHRLLGRQRGELAHVGHRGACGHAFAVGQRERAAKTFEQFQAARLSLGLDQRIAQLIVPASRGRGQARFDGLAIPGRNLPGHGAHREVDARQRGIAQLHVVLGARAGKRIEQNRLQLHAQVGRVGVARHVDQARDEAVEGVGPGQQAQALAFAQRQDAHRVVVERVVGQLVELVARVGLHQMVQRLLQVAAGGEAGARGQAAHLAAQQRGLGHPRAVGAGGEQADEAVLADHRALGVIALDADVVGVARTVHGGAGVGLGHQQQRQRRTCHFACFRGQHGEAGRELIGLGLAQHAQARAPDQAQAVGAIGPGDQIVAAVAQQREVIIGQPAQKGHRLVRGTRGQRGLRRLQLTGRLLQARTHRGPVGHRGAHFGQRMLQRGHQRGAALRVDDAVDLDVHPRLARRTGRLLWHSQCQQRAVGLALDREHRMRDQVQRQPLAVDGHGGGVDQERHVVVDDLDHRVARGPAAVADAGIEHPHLGRIGRAAGPVLPQRQHGTEQVVGRGRGDVVVVMLAQQLADAALE
jgi:hypothetical protein